MRSRNQFVQNSVKEGKWIKTSCKMCLHSCNMLAHVTDKGILNKVEGDPKSPSNRGHLCPKGNATLLRTYDPQRVTRPLKRTNPRKGPNDDPGWVPISWEEAMDIVCRELKKTLDEDPRKLLPAINDFQKLYLWAWPAAFGGNANYFTVVGTLCGGGYHPMCGMIHSTFAGANCYDYCNYWINLGGCDGFSSHLHVASQIGYMAEARVDRGMKLVTFDPRLSSSGAKSDQGWYPIRPATDRQFVMGMMHVLVYEDLYDKEFMKRDSNAVYLVGPNQYILRNEEGKPLVWDPVDNMAKTYDDETIKDYALEGTYEVEGYNAHFKYENYPPSVELEKIWEAGKVKARPSFQVFKDILADCTPEKISEITTVPADVIRKVSRDFAKEASIGSTIEIDGRTLPLRPAALNYYRGAQGHKKGSQTNHAMKLVNMLVGNMDAPGGHIGVTLDDFRIDRGHVWEGEGGHLLPTPHQLHPEVPFAYPPNTDHLMDYFPLGVDPGHLINDTFFNREKYGYTHTPDTMLICHSNPLWNMPGDQEKYFEIMRQMRFVVAIDILLNETTVWADIVLPTLDSMERWNMFMIEPPNTEGVCLQQPVVESPPECRSEEDIFNEISERIGILDTWNDILNFANHFHEKPEIMLEHGKKYTDKDLAEKRGLLWNDKPLEWYMENGHAVTKRKPEKWFRPWEGLRLNFYIELIVQERDKLKEKMEEAKVPFRHEWDWDDYQPLPVPDLDPVHFEPPEYDLYAFCYKDVQMNFSENLTIPWIADIVYRDPVHQGILINPKTAAERNIENGDLIQVESQYGYLKGLAKVTEGVHHESIGISNAITKWMDYHAVVKPGGGNFNRILPADLKNTDANSAQMECTAKVKVKKIRSKSKKGLEGLREITFTEKE